MTIEARISRIEAELAKKKGANGVFSIEDIAFLVEQSKSAPDAPGKVTIKQSEYDELQRESAWLSALDAAGVDNWEGCSPAHDIFVEWGWGEDDED